MNPGVFRKRIIDFHPDHDPWSSRLRELGDLVSSQNSAGLLAAINQELSVQTSPIRQSQVLSLVGDNQVRSGDFDGALIFYDRAANLARNDPQKWFRPIIGSIISLLKSVELTQAQVRADAAIAKAQLFEQQHAAQLAQLETQAQAGIVVVVRPRPLRLSVVATRLGKIFFDEGEVALANAYFQQALIASPQGASRARLAQAEIAMREGRLQDAKDSALAALRVGKFHAKTIAAISIFLQASDRLGDPMIDARLLDGLAQAKPQVRDRAMLAIVRALRAQNNPIWKNFASTWLGANALRSPVVATEFNKMFQSAERVRNESVPLRLAASSALMAMPELSPTEFVSAVKEYTLSSLLLGQNVDLLAFGNQAAAAYGGSWSERVLHSVALSCMKANRHDLARPLLQAEVNSGTRSVEWGKSLWALARMEATLGNYSDASVLYDQYANEAAMPLRFRLQARLKWLQSVIAGSGSVPIPTEVVLEQLSLATAQINDIESLFDVARQVSTDTPQFLWALGRDLFKRGERLAVAQFNDANSPAAALDALWRVTRGQYEFGENQKIWNTWTGLTASKRDWLWSTKSKFWEYIGIVVKAAMNINLQTEAEGVMNMYVNDGGTPLVGRLEILAAYGAQLISSGNYSSAISLFTEVTSLAPTDHRCAEAFYWLALSAKKNGDSVRCKDYAKKLRIAQGSKVGIVFDRRLDCKAIILLSNLQTGTALQSSDYDGAFQDDCLAAIQEELDLL